MDHKSRHAHPAQQQNGTGRFRDAGRGQQFGADEVVQQGRVTPSAEVAVSEDNQVACGHPHRGNPLTGVRLNVGERVAATGWLVENEMTKDAGAAGVEQLELGAVGEFNVAEHEPESRDGG